MDPERWQQIRALFDELVGMDPARQAERLTEVGLHDAELRTSVELLIAADSDATTRLGATESPFVLPALASDPFGLSGRTILHFRVLAPLEAGGMGMVYRAEDTQLDRTIALKFLLPQYQLDESAKARFLREARSAAALDHPNLCTIYQVGESEDGRLFIAMPLYPGETLKERLARDGPLSIPEAVEIARQIAAGLGCAHQAGIVHRDLKPGNVMLLPTGTVKILDFGLAKARDLSLTGSHTTLGTVTYMAPEQIRGEAVDARADLWALGVVLYEMLTGKRPFDGDRDMAVASAIVHAEPAALSALRPEAPAAVEKTVLALLEKDPDARTPSAAVFLRELPSQGAEPTGPRNGAQSAGWLRELARTVRSRPKRLVAGAGIVAIAVAALLGVNGNALPGRSLGAEGLGTAVDRRSVAILPFENLSDDPGNEYLASGIQDEILIQLFKLGELRVINRSSVERYAGTRKPLQQIGEELKVAAILSASVQRIGNRVRVIAHLDDARTAEQLWGETYDEDLNDLFAIQSEVAQAIASALHSRLTASERAGMARAPTRNAEAYNLYLQGKEHQRRSVGSNDQLAAERLYRRALELDPDFALAHARLSVVHSRLYIFGSDPTQARSEAARYEAETALRLQPDLPEAHLAMGNYLMEVRRDYPSALRELEIARRELPGAAEPLMVIAYTLRRQGRFEEALAMQLDAAKLDPLGPQLARDLAHTYTWLRRYPEAAQAWDRAIELNPDSYYRALEKGLLFIQWTGTTDSLAAALRRSPQDADPNAAVAYERVRLARLRRQPNDAVAVLRASRQEFALPLSRAVTPSSPLALLRAKAYDEAGDPIRARAQYDSTRLLVETELMRNGVEPTREAALRLALGEAYAGLGRHTEAVREARRAEALVSLSLDAVFGQPFAEGAARIFARVGEKDEALQRLGQLLRIPGPLSVQMLRLDPSWDLLRSDPEFQRLLDR